MKKAINYSPNPYGKVKKLIFKLFAVVFVFLIILAIVINVRNHKHEKTQVVNLATFNANMLE